MVEIEFTSRQKRIIELVKEHQPITSEQLAEKLNMTRAALRPDLTILTMTEILEARPKVGYLYTGKAARSIPFDFIKAIKVADIKSNPVVVAEETTVHEAVVILFMENVGTIYVQNKGTLTGVVSRKDFIKIAIGNTDIDKMPVAMVMSRMPNLVYVTDTDTAYDAIARIIEHEIDSIPVVELYKNEQGKDVYRITGKISKTNITKLLYDLCKE